MIRSWLAAIFILLSCLNSLAQIDIPVGTWRTHNSYNSLLSLAASDTKIYAANINALFIYDPATNESINLTSLNGLNGSNITTIGYNSAIETLIIAYENGNIDLLKDQIITNFTDLLVADFTGSKRINHIFHNQNLSYLSSDFGVMILDLNTQQVQETLFELGQGGEKIKIYSSTILSDSLYLATEIGVMRGSLQDNLKDFNQWKFYDLTKGLPMTSTKVILTTPTGLLTAIDMQGVFEFDGSTWQNTNLLTQSEFIFGSQNADVSILTTTDSVFQYSANAVQALNTGISRSPIASVMAANNIWIADSKNGLIDSQQNVAIYPNGPWKNNIVKLVDIGNTIIGLPAAYNVFFQPLRNKSGYFMFKDGIWGNFNSTGNPHIVPIPEFYDITDAAYSPSTNSSFFSSFGYGLMEIIDQETNIIDESTAGSPLINTNPPDRNVLITALALNNSQLSVANFSAIQGLHQYRLSSNSWQSYSPIAPASRSTQIIDVGNGIIWMKIARIFGGGIKVYDTFNQRELYLTRNSSAGSLPSNEIFDIALDKEGKMWVATDNGVVYYHNALNIFDLGDINPVLPIFEGQVLFKNETVSALAIDGGNRIWMSTSSGLWLFDNDGSTVVSHFNSEKDPLPSNEIIDLAINQISGEIFIASDNVLVSYRGTSTSAGQLPALKIFPNPLLATENDIATIEGVPENAQVIITDASGRMVFKTTAHGNTAVWQGISSNQSLSSGVYFVFVTNKDGTQKQVGKIAIIK